MWRALPGLRQLPCARGWLLVLSVLRVQQVRLKNAGTANGTGWRLAARRSVKCASRVKSAMSERDDRYSWCELGAKLPSGGVDRNHFVQADDPNALRVWRRSHNNRDVFTSICRFSEPRRNSEYVCDFFLDIDSSDFGVARSEALIACRLLMERIGIDPDSVELFFSGAKGYHVVVPKSVFGDPEGQHVMTVWSHLARRLIDAGCPHIDTAVYEKSRLWRLPNSINTKTGLYKIALEYKELADLGLDYVLGLAKQPREFDSAAVPIESPKATKWMHDALAWAEREAQLQARRPRVSGRGWRLPPCIKAIERSTIPDGMRHIAYYNYARFFATIGADASEIRDRLEEIDARNPIRDRGYLAQLARRIAKYAGFRRCPKDELAEFCDTKACPMAQRSIAEE